MADKKFNKKVLLLLTRWDYCDKSRGESAEAKIFFEAISRLVSSAEIFYYDEYINDFPKLHRLVYEKAEAYNPDLIFWPTYTNQFDAQFLDKLKKRWATCAWFGDDTWRFESYTAGLAPHFTHVCTTDIFSIAKYRKLGIDPILTQWAAIETGPESGQNDKYKYDVSFIGASNQVRSWFINTLKNFGINVECFGYRWPNGKVSYQEMNKIFKESKINLNLSNSVSRDIRFVLGAPMNFARYIVSKKTAEQIKARNFEIPLAGGFQLTNYVAGLEQYLEIGREVAVYSTPEECADQIRYYLANENERRVITEAGHKRTLSQHTYLHRFEAILGRIWR